MRFDELPVWLFPPPWWLVELLWFWLDPDVVDEDVGIGCGIPLGLLFVADGSFDEFVTAAEFGVFSSFSSSFLKFVLF